MERLLRRAHASGFRSLAFVVVGLGLAAACSDDDGPGSGGPGSVGGEGGDPNGSTAGKDGGGGKGSGGSQPSAGSAAGGAPADGGTSPMAGAAGTDVGDGGVGGAPPTAPLLGEQCTACGATECTNVLEACGENAECKAWLSCVEACADGACTDECDRAHGSPARVYAGIYDCLCSSCAEACTGVDACGKQTCVDERPLAATNAAPATLAETGLYVLVDDGGGSGGAGSGGAGGAPSVELASPLAIASDVRTYEVSYPLWADGAAKQHYLYLPKCSTIDTSDMNHWKFPVGTRIWKTFALEGKAIETRLMVRHGSSEADWLFAAYQWDESDPANPAAAKLVENPAGVQNANGTAHDIPSVAQCLNCHNKLSERVLGFSALQLSHAASGKDVAIKEISQLGWLTAPAPEGFTVPGTAVQQAALGYLHGNCGGCHNQGQSIPGTSPLYLRLLVEQTDYATTDAVKSTVSQPMVSVRQELTGKQRIHPMDAANSGLLIRMKARTPPDAAGLQMPAVGTEIPDTNGGVKAVTDWIGSIPVPQN